MDKNTLALQLNKGMQCLTQNERNALLLTYFEDLNEKEVCEVLSIDINLLINLLSSAKLKMRNFTNIFDEYDRKQRQKTNNAYQAYEIFCTN